MSSFFSNKLAVVTGGVSGIGKSTVQRLLENNCRVIIADYNETAGIECEKYFNSKFTNENEKRIYFIKTDISNEDDCQNLVKQAEEIYKTPIDFLVNNAAYFYMKSVLNFDKEEFLKSLNVNLVGTALMTKYVVKNMIKNYDSVNENNNSSTKAIVNIGSISSFVAQPEFMTYSATKAGILQMTKNMALDLNKYKIRVNCVCPGTIYTPALENYCKSVNITLEDVEKGHKDTTIMQRLGDPLEVADAIVYLLSDKSSYITGTHLSVDGGYLSL